MPSFEMACERIWADLLGLKDRFPHLRKLDRSHIENNRLDYSHGHRHVPNPDYDPDRKHKLPGPFSMMMDEWQEHGIRLSVILARELVDQCRGSAPQDDPDWTDIGLCVYREDGLSYARIGEVQAEFRLEGPDSIGAIRTALLQILRKHLPSG